MIERIYYRVKLNTDQIIYSQYKDLEAKLNENIIKDPSKTYLVWKGNQFPNSTDATFKAPEGCVIDWGDGNVETFETVSAAVNTHTYTDGFEYHLISLSNYTVINEKAFKHCDGLIGLVLSDKVVNIRGNAFNGCKFLTSITLPNSVKGIGDFAFFNCIRLTSITIPDSVTSIGSSAFSSCLRLKTIKILAENPPTIVSSAFAVGSNDRVIVPKSAINAYKSAAGWSTYADKIVYEVDSSDLVGLEAKLNENIVKDPSKTYLVWKGDKFLNGTYAAFKAPAGCTIDWGDGNVETFETASTEVNTHTYSDGFEYHLISLSNYTVIDNSAFYNCSGLTNVIIGTSVTSIGARAFYNCSGLTSITIPNSVTIIDMGAFGGCSGLTSITIPNSVTIIDMGAFGGCSGLKTVKISTINPPTLGSNAFDTSIEKIIVPKSAINAYKSAAGWSTYADKIVYEVDSSDLVSLEAKLNENIIKDPSKTYLVWKGNQFPNSTDATFKAPEGCVIDWGDGNVETFETVSAAVNTHTYTDGIEYHLISLSNYTVIDSASFNYCSGLTSVTIGNSVTSISNSAFRGCSSLTSVTIGNSVTSIDNNAFFGCSGLTSVTIGNSVTSIGNNAFRDCSGLTSIIIPDSVTFIDIGAFSGCSGLKTVKISAINPPTIDYSTFSETSLEKIIVPKSAINTYKSAAIWSTYADKIVYEVDSSDLDTIVTNLENGTGDVLIQTTDSNQSFKVMTDGRAKVQSAPVDTDDVVRKLELDRKFDKTGGTVTGDIVVGGNFTVQGKTTTVDSETLRVTDKLIEVGKGNTAPLTSPAGLITPKYDGTNNGGIVYDHTGTAYVGDIVLDENGNVDVAKSNLQPIATRENAANFENNHLPVWDKDNQRLTDSGKSVSDFIVKLPASDRNKAYVRNADGNDTGLAYSYTDEGNTLALRNASGQLQVSNPLQDKDAANKSYSDNLTARYVSTSILGG